MTAGTAALLLDSFVMLYAMFFFLRDGEAILEKVFYYVPLSHEDEVRSDRIHRWSDRLRIISHRLGNLRRSVSRYSAAGEKAAPR